MKVQTPAKEEDPLLVCLDPPKNHIIHRGRLKGKNYANFMITKKKGSLLLRGGLIGAIASSILVSCTIVNAPFDMIPPLHLSLYLYFGLIVGGFGLFFFAFLFYLGVIITSYKAIQLKQFYILFKQFVTNKQILAVVSMIVATWALVPIPQVFLFPFFGRITYFGGTSSFAFPLDVGKELEQSLLIEIVRGILTHPDLESGLIGRLIRFIAIGVLICTVFYLVWALIKLIKDFKHIKEKTNLRTIFLEFCFSFGILLLLIFEIIKPIWEFVDPYGFGMMWWSSFLIEYFFTVPLSIFFLLFLITGRFENGYIVIEDTDKIKSRTFISISLTVILFGYSCLPLLW